MRIEEGGALRVHLRQCSGDGGLGRLHGGLAGLHACLRGGDIRLRAGKLGSGGLRGALRGIDIGLRLWDVICFEVEFIVVLFYVF